MNIDGLFENVIKSMYFPIVSELVDKKAKHVWVFLLGGGGNKKMPVFSYKCVFRFTDLDCNDTGFRTVGTSNGAPPIDRIVRYVVDMGYPAIQQ